MRTSLYVVNLKKKFQRKKYFSINLTIDEKTKTIWNSKQKTNAFTLALN